MRLNFALLSALALLCGSAFALSARAQNPETMMPEANIAKAKEILQQLIAGLGGPAYLQVRESECQGRRAQFGHNGALTGYVDFLDDRRYPDKDRTEYIGKGHNSVLGFLVGIDGLDISHGGVVTVLFDGDHGWTMDRGGVVSELPAGALTDFQEQVKRNIDNLLRLRLNEEGMSVRFAGNDTVDLKQVDWVELTDRDQRTFRLAVDRSTHLLVRAIISTSDEATGEHTDETILYSNYQRKDGVQVPLQVSRERNDLRIAQFFYDSCKMNPGFPDNLFTQASLSKKYSQSNYKKDKDKYKNDRD